MEQNTPLMAKKIWNVLRVALYMLRKGICKRKMLMDLNLVMKRGKIAKKALQNIMFNYHHHNHHNSISEASLESQFKPQGGEYEFSCSNTPLYRHYFNNKKSKNQHTKNFSFEDMDNIEGGVNNMFDMIMLSSNNEGMLAKSPSLPGLGLGLTARAKQIRVTDSPFPTQGGEDAKHVDAAADEFIKNFYSQLKQQKNY